LASIIHRERRRAGDEIEKGFSINSTNEGQQAEAQWHWAEGNKYALEVGRALILINGAAAIGIMTFLGHYPPRSFGILRSLNMFGSGAFLGTVFFAFAYLAQLMYGNRSRCWSILWHWCAYFSALFSAGLFAWGMYTATETPPRG